MESPAVLKSLIRKTRPYCVGFFVVVCVLNVVRVQWAVNDGPGNCSLLYDGGRLYGDRFQANGCMMGDYLKSHTHLGTCIGDGGVVFVGDGEARAFYKGLQHDSCETDIKTRGGVVQQCVLPLSEGQKLCTTFYDASLLGNFEQNMFEKSDAKFVVLSWGSLYLEKTHSSRHPMLETEMKTFRGKFLKRVKRLVAMVKKAFPKATLYWIPFVPKRGSDVEELVPLLQKDALEAIRGEALGVSTFFSVVENRNVDWENGEVDKDKTLLVKTGLNLVLNSFCNAPLLGDLPISNRLRKLPFGATCCLPVVAPYTTLQTGTFIFFLGCLLMHLYFKNLKKKTPVLVSGLLAPVPEEKLEEDGTVAHSVIELVEQNDLNGQEKKRAVEESEKMNKIKLLVESTARLGLCMVVFLLCDRTLIFETGQKYFDDHWFAFFAPVGITFAAGFLSMKQVACQPTFLNRDQTDEWKGWMQLAFLFYHYAGVSKMQDMLPVYVSIRFFVASYLFMTGYGHFTYFYKKKDFGLKRVVQVLFRVNILAICLAFSLDQKYNFYYFCPLSSFWFLLTWAFMFAGHSSNQNAKFMTFKFLILAIFLTGFWYQRSGKSPMETIFSMPGFYQLMESKGSLKDWYFRTHLDFLAAPFGMLIAYLYIILKEKKVVKDSGNLFSSSLLTVALSVASIVGLAIFFSIAVTCGTKSFCNSLNPFSSPLAIFGFILLRNMTEFTRRYFSTFFAYFGQISLELFLSQYHLWLANDTTGLLVLIPGFRLLNFLATSWVFVVVANELSHASGELTKLISW